MSAAEHADDEPFHQAGWVYFATYGACLSFLGMLMLAKAKFAAGFGIIWFTLGSMPIQLHFARRDWSSFGIASVVTGGGYVGLTALMGMGGAGIGAGVGVLWLILGSMFIHWYLAERQWVPLGIAAAVTAAGYFGVVQIF